MFEQNHLPDFLESSLIEPSKVWQNFKTWLEKLSIWQKFAILALFLGMGLGAWGWWSLRQKLDYLNQDLNILMEKNSKISSASEKIPDHSAENQLSSQIDQLASLSAQVARITVHLAGAVKKPGIYNLAAGSLLADAVKAAGGLSSAVWQDYFDQYINLAEPLEAYQKIWVPSLDQKDLVDVSRLAVSGAELPTESTKSVQTTYSSEGVSINQASLAELMELTGIGQKRAEDIISNRPYANLEELMSKAGLSLSVFSAIKAQLLL